MTGGDKVLIHLVHYLKKEGYSVGILFLSHFEKYLQGSDYIPYKKYIYSLRTINKIFILFFHNKIGYEILQIRRRVLGESDEARRLRNIFTYFQYIPSEVFCKRVVAVGWRSAFLMNKMCNSSKKYYLIQHDEDDPSYSGNLSTLVEKTYHFTCKKIVYNEHLFKRFYDESPIRLNMGIPWRPKNNKSPDKKIGNHILLVLRSGESKGAEYAIKAASIVSNTIHADFRSFGDFNGQVPTFIKHYGWVNKKLLSDLYSWASILVLPSVIEGYSLTAAEAGSAGCAIVASDCVGIREYIEDSINGFLVPVKSPGIMASKIIELVEDNNKRVNFAVALKNKLLNQNFDNTYKDFITGIIKNEGSI